MGKLQPGDCHIAAPMSGIESMKKDHGVIVTLRVTGMLDLFVVSVAMTLKILVAVLTPDPTVWNVTSLSACR